MITTVVSNDPKSINTSLFELDRQITSIENRLDKVIALVNGINPKAGVISVNKKQGIVTLGPEDVHALPDTTVIPSRTSQLTNDSGYITGTDAANTYVPLTRTVNNKQLNTNITLDASDVGALPDTYVAPVTSVNNKTGSVVLDATDVGALPDNTHIPVDPVQANWTEADNTKLDYIKNKPNLATVATSGSYNDLSDKPSIPAAQVNSDWNANSGVAEILNKPNLATVATSGSYNDLSDKPSIPAAQVNSDWNASSGVAQILNKPSLATVATSGSYNDLSDKPTIVGQVNSDWNATSGVAEILNKPSIPTKTSDLTNDSGFVTSSGTVDHADAITGFSRTNGAAWGNQTGTVVAGGSDGEGGDYVWRKNNPSSGKLSLVLDGTVYVDEGVKEVATKDDIPTATSQLTNDSGYITSGGACRAVRSTGWGSSELTYLQTSEPFYGNNGWTHYLIANHGDGSSYYNFTLGLPFWGIPIYQRKMGGTDSGWQTFWTTENLNPSSFGKIIFDKTMSSSESTNDFIITLSQGKMYFIMTRDYSGDTPYGISAYLATPVHTGYVEVYTIYSTGNSAFALVGDVSCQIRVLPRYNTTNSIIKV